MFSAVIFERMHVLIQASYPVRLSSQTDVMILHLIISQPLLSTSSSIQHLPLTLCNLYIWNSITK